MIQYKGKITLNVGYRWADTQRDQWRIDKTEKSLLCKINGIRAKNENGVK